MRKFYTIHSGLRDGEGCNRDQIFTTNYNRLGGFRIYTVYIWPAGKLKIDKYAYLKTSSQMI